MIEHLSLAPLLPCCVLLINIKQDVGGKGKVTDFSSSVLVGLIRINESVDRPFAIAYPWR